ncbi:MAG: hypothetical protein AB7K71_27055 [Polyangiaceae bacterium]
MKHVHVETNFIVDLLRPFATRAALALHARHGQDITLHIPWCAISEARWTLPEVINEDLAFPDLAGRFLRNQRMLSKGQASSVKEFIDLARKVRVDTTFSYPDAIANFAQSVTVIPPSQQAVDETLSIRRAKRLKPFDEMVLGSVLSNAKALSDTGERELYFCNRNTKDFMPTAGNGLDAEYSKVGLTYLGDFKVP